MSAANINTSTTAVMIQPTQPQPPFIIQPLPPQPSHSTLLLRC